MSAPKREYIQEHVIFGALIFLAAVSGIILAYLFVLRSQFAKSTDPDVQKLFPHMALGLPDGSVRAGLAVLIVLGSLIALVASVLPDLGFKPPEALIGVLGTILGFYFGRSGGAETAENNKTLAQAVTAKQDAAASAAQDQARQATQALQTSERDHASDVAANIAPLIAAASSIVDGLAADPNAKPTDDVAKAKTALEAAQASGKAADVKAALDSFQRQGPIANLVQALGPALAPLVSGGSTAAAMQALAAVGTRLAPVAAQHWVARLLNAPYRDGLISPTIDDAYASRLLADVPQAGDLVRLLQSTPPTTAAPDAPPLNAVEIVKLVLRENAVASLAEMWAGKLSAATSAGPIEALQRRALEIQLEGEVPPELLKPFGGFAAFFKSLDAVQSAPDGPGLRALDLLVLAVRSARQAGAAVADLLPPASTS